MKSVRITLVFIILAIVAGSCSKENLIARRLEGVWKIDVYQKSVYGDNLPVISQSSSVSNAGTFEFREDGTGLYNILKNLGSNTYTGDAEFLWTNTKSTLSIKTNSSTNKYDLTETKKSKMVLERTVKNYYFPGNDHNVSYEMEERITLTK